MPSSLYQELWVNGRNGQSLCALINGHIGWLMYLREDGDAGFSSRNPDYSGPKEAAVEYVLANGQRDECPASWALPLPVVMQTVDYFRAEGRPPPFVMWHNDADDDKRLNP